MRMLGCFHLSKSIIIDDRPFFIGNQWRLKALQVPQFLGTPIWDHLVHKITRNPSSLSLLQHLRPDLRLRITPFWAENLMTDAIFAMHHVTMTSLGHFFIQKFLVKSQKQSWQRRSGEPQCLTVFSVQGNHQFFGHPRT